MRKSIPLKLIFIDSLEIAEDFRVIGKPEAYDRRLVSEIHVVSANGPIIAQKYRSISSHLTPADALQHDEKQQERPSNQK